MPVADILIAFAAIFAAYDLWLHWNDDIEGWEYECPDWKVDPK